MSSKKFEKYMNQYGDRNYAVKTRKVEKSDVRKYFPRSQIRETCETSSCDSIFSGQKEQEKIEDQKGEEMKKQGYNDRLDESLGEKDKGKKMKQPLKARRKESEAMEKAVFKKKFSGDKKMK